ncbi:MAG: isochorismatase family cysteine hydrolase [Polyangiales bacterium]
MPSPENNPDLHGNVPDQSLVALLLIDVLNSMQFEGSQPFATRAASVGQRIAALKAEAKRVGVPVIYVNDNSHGRWRSDLTTMLKHGFARETPGGPVLRELAPAPDDYVVLKPKHSGFYATPLDTVLQYMRVKRLVLAGFTTDQCVLFTASDAFIRDYQLFVPSDCTATVEPADAEPALRLMRARLHVDTRHAADLDWQALRAQ